MLYIRMLLTMVVSLYTSRIVLEALGVEDFGIYNVVGGIIILFSFINGAMSSSTQRFLTYEIGKANVSQIKKVFNTSVIIHFILALLVLIVGETIGLWFLQNEMNIPEYRINAAFWVYQLSIIASIISIISLPYNATIIAYEKMNAFAYISIFEVLAKFLLAYLLLIASGDRLILYALFICVTQIVIRILYSWYCRRSFPEIRFAFSWDKTVFKEMLSFCGWNTFGSLAGVSGMQGLDILLNLFFGPVVNAARGISTQVQAAVNSFCVNFQTAVNPQITKSYAAGDFKYFQRLVFTSSRMSFYLILLLSLPIILETNQILHLWLKTVPEHSIIFIQLSMVIAAFNALGAPLITANMATGNIRKLFVAVGLINCCVIPLAYIWLKFGGAPWSVLTAQIIIMVIAFLVRLKIIGKQLSFSLLGYVKNVLLQIILVTLICFPIVFFIKIGMIESFFRLICVVGTSIFTVAGTVYFIGITPEERNAIKKIITNKIMKK